MRLRTLALTCVIIVAGAHATAQARDITVIATAAWPTVIHDITPAFERATGDHLVVEYGGPADVSRRLKSGAPFDVALSSAAALKDLAAQGVIDAAQPLGVAHTVLIYPKGRAAPEASTPEAVAALVRQARKIAYTDPSTGASTGIFFLAVVRQAGLDAELASKALIVKPAAGGVPVDTGEADLGVALTCEVAELKNVASVRLMPSDPRDTTSFAYGRAKTPANPEGARKLMEFIASPEMTKAMAANGFARE